jgi:uncharacterized protein YgbK (DUF1537 family)
MAVLVIADDLTGANDTIVQFAKRGMKSIMIFKLAANLFDLNYQALAFQTGSRGLSEKDAYQINRSLVHNLKINPTDLVYKKIDSAVRGNIGTEITAFLDELPHFKAALVAPAFPDNKRITCNGYQLINGIPVHESEIAADPITPVLNSHLPTLLESQSHLKTGHIALGEMNAGAEAIRDRLQKLLEQNCRIIIADAATNSHLNYLAEVIAGETEILPCGSAGLAEAFANLKGFDCVQQQTDDKENQLKRMGIQLAIIGSKSPISAAQVAEVKTGLPETLTVMAHPDCFFDQELAETEVEQAVRRIDNRWDGNQAIMLYVLQENTASTTADASKIVAGLAEIGCRIFDKIPIRRLFVTGGDTVSSLFDKLGVEALEIQKELEHGICQGKVIGGVADGLEVITKAGSFGDAGTLMRFFKEWRI